MEQKGLSIAAVVTASKFAGFLLIDTDYIDNYTYQLWRTSSVK